MAPITRVSNLEIKSDARNKEKGFYVDALTTVQRDAIPTKTNGLLIYNTETNTFQAYQNGTWTNLSTGGATTLQAPVLATVSAPVAADGMIYYDSTTDRLTTGVNGAYVSIYTSPLAQDGNLVMKTAALDPVAIVPGEIYYNTTSQVIRALINGIWNTVNTSLQTATGNGLTAGAGSPFTLPHGTNAAENGGNEVLGFMFFNTQTGFIRTWDGAWKTVTLV